MNIPNRASCHHFIRRMRSMSPVGAPVCCDGAAIGCPGTENLSGKTAAANAELVPAIHSRRDVRFFIIKGSSPELFTHDRLRSLQG
jgi:hypothetical protein